MGTITTWTAEGLADQAVLNATNVPANQVNFGSPSYGKASVAAAILGSRGYELSVASTLTSNVRLALTSNLTQGGQFLFRVGSGNSRRFWTARHASGDVFRLTLSSGLVPTLTTAGGASPLTGPTLTANTAYIVDWLAVVATTTTGQISVRFSTLDGTVLGTITSGTYNLGTAAIAFADMGSGSDSSAGASLYHFDNIRVEDGRTTYFPSPVPGAGTVAGTYTYVGAATGTTTRSGTVAGAYAYAGAAAGKRTSKGTASGVATWTGAATGASTRAGTVAGAYAFTGTAAGKRTPKGAVAGTATWTGDAAGKREPKGTASGTYSWAGQAAGGVSRSGQVTGAWAYSGSPAQGHREPKATVSGAYSYLGLATGTRPSVVLRNITGRFLPPNMTGRFTPARLAGRFRP